jgi:uncharacterized protein (TIGR03437 family)
VRVRRTGPPSTLAIATAVTNVSGGAWLAVGSFSGDGLPLTATPGSLGPGTYEARVTINVAGGGSYTVTAFLRILTGPGGAAATLVRPSALSFRMTQGGANPDPKTLNVSSPTGGSGFTWSASRTITTPAGGNWYQISPTINTTGPGQVNVTINGAGLGVGTYTGTITVTSGGNTVVIPVTLEVRPPESTTQGQPAGPKLIVVPQALNFIMHLGGSTPGPKTLRVKSTGQGSLNWTATAMSTGGWLSITGASGTTPGNITVLVGGVTGFGRGSYEGKVQVTGGGRTETVRVFLRVVGGPGSGGGPATTSNRTTTSVVQINPRAVEFSATGGVVTPASVPLQISSTVSGLTFAATRSTSQGGNWLNISSTGGPVPATVNVTVTLGSLGPGLYTGLITLNIAGSVTEQRLVLVTLRVSAPGDAPRLRVNPGAVSFQATRGGANPAAKSVAVEAVGASSIPFQTTVSTVTGGNWLSVSPATGTAPVTVNVSASITNLAAGNYVGAVVFQATGSPGAIPTSLGVVLNVNAPGANVATLQGLLLSPGPEFVAAAGLPTEVRAQLWDASGNPVDGAEVQVSASTEETSLLLDGEGGGLYSGVLRSVTGGPVALTGTAIAGDGTMATFGVGGDLQSPPEGVPVIFRQGIVSTANYAPGPTPAAPGSILSLFGASLANQSEAAAALPLPTELGGVKVLVGGIEAPLLSVTADAAPGMDQINFQLPVEAGVWTYADVVVLNNGVFSDAEGIGITPSIPALFTVNQSGTGPAAALHANFSLVDRSAPARAGETISLFATGLGAVNPPASTGQAPRSLSTITGTMEVRIGGRLVVVSFAGLAPGFVGLYQINVVVPSGLPAGEAALEVVVDGITSGEGVTVPMG